MPRTANTTSDVCGATRKKGKGKCKLPAGYKTSHPGYGLCHIHGGATPAGEVSAERNQAKKELKAFGRELDIEPHQALLRAIRLAAGEVDAAQERIDQLEEEQLLVRPEEEVERPLKEEKGAENPGVKVKEFKRLQLQLNEWIRIRQESTDRLVRYSAAALKSGLEERLVRVAEIQGKLMAEAVQSILKDLGVLDHPEAPKVVRYHLTRIQQLEQGGADGGGSAAQA